jgi:microcompartment protein CcmL/EutN
VTGADKNTGAFFSPILFLNDNPFAKTDVHEIEAFGPVSTIMPYKTMDDAIELAKMGKGSLVSSIVTPNDKEATEYVVPSGRKTIIEDLQQCLRDCKVKYKKTPEFEDAKDVKDYIDYLNELCDKNDVGLRVKSNKKTAKK